MRAAPEDASRPRVDLGFTVDRHLWTLTHQIDSEIKAAAAIFGPEWKEKILAAWERQRPMNHALHYADGEYQLRGLPAAKRPTLKERLEEGFGLASLGKYWLKPLAHVGAISEEMLAKILAGTTADDMIDDLQRCGPLLYDNRGLLAGMQRFVTDESRRITPELIERMSTLGVELRDALAATRDAVDEHGINWKQMTVGLFLLLEADYTVVRHAVRCYLALMGREDEADAIPTLRGMSQLGRTRVAEKDEEEAKPVDEPADEDEGDEEDGETEDDAEA